MQVSQDKTQNKENNIDAIQIKKEGKAPIKHRHLLFMILLALLMLLTVVAIVTTSVIILNRTTREHRTQIIEHTAKLAATYIDGDLVEGWMENGKDAAYESTADTLESILRNIPYLQYLYVYQIKEDGCHVVFDFDSVDEETGEIVEAGAFRELIEFDESWEELVPTLLAGGSVETIETIDTYGWLLTRYEPIYDSTGKCVCYVGTDLSMKGVHDYVTNYVILIAAIAGVFLAGCILLGMRIYIGARRADQMESLIERQKRDKELTREIIEAFAKVVDLKDAYTQGHSFRVAKYTDMLARELNCDEETIEKYHNIALMHDIGKVGIPDSVLNKPGKLTDDEYGLIKSHTSRGYDVLENISLMPEIAIGAQAHHERPDGKGYPLGLKESEIPRVAQIIAVADCFDAMYSNRPYRSRMNFEKVVSIIKEASGTQLTPDVVDAFLRLVEKGEFRAPDDFGGGSTESIENIRNDKKES
ncbi:MAG: HD-GYP domain-containing protein [Clostridia bacterium]|nr:HD-GYP domain-containing protein [Clostridia bacterium]